MRSIFTTLLILSSGCALDREGPAERLGERISDRAGDVGEELDEVGREIRGEDKGPLREGLEDAFDDLEDALTRRDRDRFSDRAEDALDDIDVWIEQRGGELDQAGEESRAEVKRLRAELEAIEGPIDEEAWEKSARDLRDALRDLTD
ncbi:MAG: hypothetical protein ACI8S6_002606 [Myxococcota bacterium]|jgi:hypothetical protein